MVKHGSSVELNSQAIREILALRLLIARAAGRDGLAWWDDESLSAPAAFLLERLFPVAPPLAARRLALAAALARHRAACPDDGDLLHLYRLDSDGRDRLAIRSVPLLPIPMPEEPIPTLEALRQHLRELTGGPAPYTVVRRRDAGALELDYPRAPQGLPPLLQRARTLAWAYLEGAPGAPVFPCCWE